MSRPPQSMREAARALALRGFCVHPLDGKIPTTPHGVLDATKDLDLIERWWTAAPDADIGVACELSDLVVIDLDCGHREGEDGFVSIVGLEAELGKLPATYSVETGGGGAHRYFRQPASGERIRSRAGLRPGVDVKADGGYVVAPPSLHASGNRYRLARELAVAELPPRWLEFLRAGKKPPPVKGDSPVQASKLFVALEHAGLVRSILHNGNAAIDCPNRAEHTGDTALSSTVLMPPNEPGGPGWIHCSHAHCSGKPLEFWLDLLPEASLRHAGFTPPRTSGGGGGKARRIANEPEGESPLDGLAWDEPHPLSVRSHLPQFPFDELPAVAAAFVRALAASTATDPALAAIAVLGAYSGGVAGKVIVQVRDDWTEDLSAYFIGVADVGERKSAVAKAVRAPIAAYLEETELADRPRHAAAKASRQVIEETIAATKKKSRGAKTPDERRGFAADLAALEVELSNIERVLSCGALLEDITPEALVPALASTGGRGCVIDAEAGFTTTILNPYGSDGTDVPTVLLKGYTGERIDQRRVSRAAETVDHPAMSIALLIQPEVVRNFGEHRRFVGLGLFARINWAMPPGRVGHRSAETPPIPARVAADYAAWMTRAWQIPPPARPHTLLFDHDVRSLVNATHDRVEALLAETDPGSAVRGWYAKHVGRIARIAGLLACGDFVGEGLASRITVEHWMRAERIGEYFGAHAEAAAGAMRTEPDVLHAERILRRAIPFAGGEISRRQIQEWTKNGMVADEMDRAIDVLIREGAFQELAPRGKTKRARRFAVHPRAERFVLIVLAVGGVNFEHTPPSEASKHKGFSTPPSETRGGGTRGQ